MSRRSHLRLFFPIGHPIILLALLTFLSSSTQSEEFSENSQAQSKQGAVPPAEIRIQRERPRIAAQCYLSDDESACQLSCVIENSGSAAARDVAVGFVSYLPTQTQLAAPPDARIELGKSATLPIPDPAGQIDRQLRAFTIQIPVIPPGSKLPFTVWTDDDNNRKACQQLIKIRQIGRQILADFFARILETHAAAPSQVPNLDLLSSATAKKGCLFQPDFVLSEQGRGPVGFITPVEAKSLKMVERILPALKPKFIDTFKNRGECMAPIFTVEQTGGTSVTFAVFPPHVRTYITGHFNFPPPKEGLEWRPVPPANYECTPDHS